MSPATRLTGGGQNAFGWNSAEIFTHFVLPFRRRGLMRQAVQLMLAVAILLSAQSALACASHRSPADRIASGYARGGFSAVIVVSVVSANFAGNNRSDWQPWQALSNVRKQLVGHVNGQQFLFGRSGSHERCEDGMAPPQNGDLWVIYFAKSGYALSYPASIAAAADPKVRALL